MDTSTLRVFAATYIMESENVSQNTKCKLINFVKEAKTDEILHLLFNGNIPTNQLNESQRFVLRSQAENFIYPLIMEARPKTKKKKGIIYTTGQWAREKGEKAAERVGKEAKKAGEVVRPHIKPFAKRVGYAVVVAAISAAAYQTYKRYMTAAAKACRGRKGTDRRECIYSFRKRALQAKLAVLQQERTACDKSKNPEKCKDKIDSKIKKVKYKISVLYSKV